MNKLLIPALCACIAVLVCIVFCQQFMFRIKIQVQLKKIAQKLNHILEADSDETVNVFTDNAALIELASQINRVLEERQKIKAEYRRSEIASKKMLSNISHDIKTPMTVILGYLEIMRLDGNAGQHEMLCKVEQKAGQVMALINQFFTLAKLEAGDMNIELSKLDICEVCRESMLDFYTLLTQKEFEVEINLPDTAVYALANRDALQRILFNLISNAVRYGADGKYLGLSVTADESRIFIRVTDRGKGIDSAFAETVFDRLFTMDDSRNRRIQGNGLGLTIARNLALQLGGNLTLTSLPSVETVFTVSLRREPR